jgi:serine/threonine protein phosphatase PrpC
LPKHRFGNRQSWPMAWAATSAGEVASGMATTVLATSNFARYIPTHTAASETVIANEDLAEAMLRIADEVAMANRGHLQFIAKGQPQYAGMATTLVLAWFYDNRMSGRSHVGDSRLYPHAWRVLSSN